MLNYKKEGRGAKALTAPPLELYKVGRIDTNSEMLKAPSLSFLENSSSLGAPPSSFSSNFLGKIGV